MPLVRWTTDDLRVTTGTLVYLDHNPIDAFEMNNGSRPHFGHELERLALLRIVLPQIELTSKESHAALIPRFDSRNAKPPSYAARAELVTEVGETLAHDRYLHSESSGYLFLRVPE
jgi:hypothetical protein